MRSAEQWRQLPVELRERPQWLLAGPNEKGELKVPTSVDNGGRLVAGSSTDASTWMDFEYAVECALEFEHGIGFVLAADDPFTCIDLDVKPDTSAEERSRHDAIVEQFDTYTERSQSGNGMHLWCMGKIGRGRKRDGIEVYSQERFIACTGNVVQHRLIADRKELLTNMVAQMPEKAADTVLADDRAAELSDNALWDRAHAASNAQKFRDLCAGNWTKYGFPSQSEADLALMSMFTFYSRNNEQCRRLFRCTQLGARAKAQDDDRHLDYMLKLIRARQAREDERGRGAAADGARFADNLTRAKTSPASADTWSIVSVADVATNPAPPPEFLIEDLLPAREVTLLPADGGAGKSLLTLIAAVCQAMGMPFMGKRVTRCKVIFYSGEDDARVLRGRLRRVCDEYGVDPVALNPWLRLIDATENPCLFAEFNEPDEGRKAVATPNLQRLHKQVADWGARAVIIDNASDTYDANENERRHVRAFIRALKELAKRYDAAVWLLAHLDKASVRGIGGNAKFSGSTAWHNSVRSRLLLAPNPDQPGQLVLSQEKSNHGRRSSDIFLAWSADGVLIHAGGGMHTPVATAEEQRTQVISLIRSYYEREMYISSSLASNAPTGAFATLSGDASYPRGLNKARLATLLRQAQADGVLVVETYAHPTRRGHTGERWRVP